MSKRHRRPRQQQVTRRYIERTVQRARDEIIRAVLWATTPSDDIPASASASEQAIRTPYSPGVAGTAERMIPARPSLD